MKNLPPGLSRRRSGWAALSDDTNEVMLMGLIVCGKCKPHTTKATGIVDPGQLTKDAAGALWGTLTERTSLQVTSEHTME